MKTLKFKSYIYLIKIKNIEKIFKKIWKFIPRRMYFKIDKNLAWAKKKLIYIFINQTKHPRVLNPFVNLLSYWKSDSLNEKKVTMKPYNKSPKRVKIGYPAGKTDILYKILRIFILNPNSVSRILICQSRIIGFEISKS